MPLSPRRRPDTRKNTGLKLSAMTENDAAKPFPAVPTEIDIEEEELYKIMGLLTPEGEPLKDAADEAMIKRVSSSPVFSSVTISTRVGPVVAQVPLQTRLRCINHSRTQGLARPFKVASPFPLMLADVQETCHQIPSRQEPKRPGSDKLTLAAGCIIDPSHLFVVASWRRRSSRRSLRPTPSSRIRRNAKCTTSKSALFGP